MLVGRYFYDGDGKRVKKEVYAGGQLTETTVFVYSGSKLIAEYSTAPPPQNPTTNYVATDILQSVRAITNALGEVTSRRDFMPFGEDLHAGVANRSETQKYQIAGADAVRQKFTGYQKDEETQLDFAEARMYENRHGRFTAVDPLLASGKSANPQTFNRYVYVMNSPLMFTDPSGLQAGTHLGKVYTDGSSFHREPFEGSHQYKGDPRYVEANDGFTYSVSRGGYYSIGNTADINARSEGIGMADSRRREQLFSESMLPSAYIAELQLDPPGYAEASNPRGGRFGITDDGETNYSTFLRKTDESRAFGLVMGAMGALGSLPGGSGSPPSIPRGFLFTGEARSGGSFGEKLFLTNTFGKDSTLFGNSRFDLSGSKREGLFNQSSSDVKAGWSSPQRGGGWQFRFGVLAIPDSRQARFHFNVPGTFVPNSFADPYQFRPARRTP